MKSLLQSEVRNRILCALPAAEFSSLAGQLTPIALAHGASLHRNGDVIVYLYFVDCGLVSTLTMLSDGQPLEIGLIGVEGVVGMSTVLGATNSHSDTICQAGGTAYRVTPAALKEVMSRAPCLRELMLRYADVLHVQTAQLAACNAHHDLMQRLVGWLLVAHDRGGEAELALTHDWVALMLGVRRATVSVAASVLQRAGFIRYHHGHITIVDRVGLEGAACECYETVAGEYRALLGRYPGHGFPAPDFPVSSWKMSCVQAHSGP